MNGKFHYVYFLQSLKDGSYYIGASNDYLRRLKEHKASLLKLIFPKGL